MYLGLYQRSVRCKTPYIGIPAQARTETASHLFSASIQKDQGGEGWETKKEQEEAKIRGTVKRDVGPTDAVATGWRGEYNSNNWTTH